MRSPHQLIAVLGVGALLTLTGCGNVRSAGEALTADAAKIDGYDWKAAPDTSKITAQGTELTTYGLSEDWAGYGEVMRAFCAAHKAACFHSNVKLPTLEQIQKFDAEQRDPVGTISDIGLPWGRVAEAKGVVPGYLPPSARRLKDWQRGKEGGWVATFAGSVAFVVNTTKVKHPPKKWADLLKPEYKGMIGAPDPRRTGIGQYMVIAAALANGGGIDDPGPGYDFFARLKRTGNLSTAKLNKITLRSGEAPIQIDYDFSGIAQRAKARTYKIKVVVPADGSIWAPSGLMINKYNIAKGDFLKGFLGYVLEDKAQRAFARAGAHPIRYLNGDLKLPPAARRNWLPARSYAPVRQIDVTRIDPARIGRDWESRVLVQGGPA
ncbi:MAG TPA: extracellular solute-binding protein [Actinomadura sp.]|jgi:putative spermidine/putrescine transport system substrate-binding protein|nr:extracellular solute-binding protein [Actinomadura sp.]